MMNSIAQKIDDWLAQHDFQLERFRQPIPLAILCSEINEPVSNVRAYLQHNREPPYHLWSHTRRGRTSPSKPYCVRCNGVDTVGLDWEDSVIGAAEVVFKNHNFQTAREIGTPQHIASLMTHPDLSILTPNHNQRDLWALRRAGNEVELYIIEAKGKEAYEFDYFCFAQALSQVFAVPSEPLSSLLGSPCNAGHGLCWEFAYRLYQQWKVNGLRPTITVAILVPEWTPDVVWSNKKVRRIPGCFYERPLDTFRHFLVTGATASESGKFKYQRAFGQILDHLETNLRIRSLAQAHHGLRFRLLTTRLSTTGSFELSGASW